MLYFLLIIIAGLLFLIYKNSIRRNQIIKEITNGDIAISEEFLSRKLESSHLKDHLDTEKVLFETGQKNYLRMKERFKHDQTKLKEIRTDWSDYIENISNLVFHSEMLDVAPSNEDAKTAYEAQDQIVVKIKEIDRRFKELLGGDYLDAFKQ